MPRIAPETRHLQALALLCLAAFTAGCASQPTTENTIRAEIVSEPPGIEILYQGKRVGLSPLELPLDTLDGALEVSAQSSDTQLVERRIKILGPEAVQVHLRYADEPSELVRRLGLSQVVVFDYGSRATFEVDEYELKDDLKPLLRRQAEILEQHFEGIDIYLCGHTDASGDADYNQVLSVRRAQAVADFLVAHGLPSDRLRVQGFGADYPLADNANTEGRALNRRTEIILPD